MKKLLAYILILLSLTAYTAYAEVAPQGTQPEEKSTEAQSTQEQSTKEPLSLLVLPFKNNTKDLSLDWLSLALQDNLTINLMYVKGVDTIAMPSYIETVGKAVQQLSLSADPEAIAIGKQLNVSQVWLGGFSHAEKDGQMLIEIRALDVQGGQEVFSKKIINSPAELSGALDQAVKEILPAYMDIQASPEELKSITSKKTASLKAWEYNASGYKVRMDFSLLEPSQRAQHYEKWSSLHKKAVEKDPGYAEAWNNLAWSLYIQGDRTGAKAAFLRAMGMKPFNISSKIGMANVLRVEKNYASAIKHMKAAVRLNPSLSWTAGQLKKALEESSSSGSLPHLLQAFEDSPLLGKPSALLAITKVKDPAATKFIGEVAKDENHDKKTRLVAINALVSSADKSVIPYLAEVLKTRSRELKTLALKGMAEIDLEASVPHITAILSGDGFDMKVVAARLSRKKKIAQTVPFLMKTVNTRTPLSIASIMALAAIGDKSAAPVLRKAFRNPNSRVRREAATALGAIGDTQSISKLLKAARRDKNGYVRVRALISLTVLGNKAADGKLINLLKKGDNQIVKYAIKHILRNWQDMAAPELKDFLTQNGVSP